MQNSEVQGVIQHPVGNCRRCGRDLIDEKSKICAPCATKMTALLVRDYSPDYKKAA